MWFVDIESIDSTQYTRLWDDYHDNNFRTSHGQFKAEYKKSETAELAFQIGPAGPLWTYYTFILKKEKCCFIFTRTTFAHARFRYKGYSVVNREKVDSLFHYIKTLKRTKVDEEENYLTASFIDNRNGDVFDVAIEEQDDGLKRLPPDSSVIKFLNFIDKKIKWTETYPLEPEVERPKFYDQMPISGSYLIDNEQGNFNGTITIEKKVSYMHYIWDITSQNGKLLAAKSSTIEFNEIPKDSDQFDFVKTCVIKEIREYKIKDNKIVIEISDSQ